MILRPLEGRAGTGPIDNLAMHETQLECPECGAFEVWHIPEQQGTCHGGEFTNSCIEYHWCESCDAYLTDKEPCHERPTERLRRPGLRTDGGGWADGTWTDYLECVMSEQKNELRQIITDALVSMVSGVTGLVPPSGPGKIPGFIQAPIDRAVERISASQPAGVPAELHARCAEILDWQASGVLSGNALRNYAAGKRHADQHHALRVAESDTARDAYKFIVALAAAPTVKAEQPDCVYCQGHGDVTRISGQTAESYSEHNEECPECKGTGLAPSLPATASSGVEEVEVVAWFFPNPDGSLCMDAVRHRPGYPGEVAAMTVAQHERIVAALSAQQSAHVSVPRELLERAGRLLDVARYKQPETMRARRDVTGELRAILNGGEA